MNRQPFEKPPRTWEPKLTPWIVRLFRPLMNRTLRDKQRMTELNFSGLENLRTLLDERAGVLVTPNHSFHYDSYVLMEAGHQVGRPFHFLTAWQVFAMSRPWNRWVLQRHGCFSINREAVDSQALKTSIEILCQSPSPLVVFAEGDIYHSNDRVTPFRDGAAAIALSAARKGVRPVYCLPCALKCFYTVDPTPELGQLLDRLEELVQWRPRSEEPLGQRIYQFAEAVLCLKELEYLGQPRSGRVSDRARWLANEVLSRLENKHGVHVQGDIPERVKEVRRVVIRAGQRQDLDEAARNQLTREMEDLFFVIQLFSYPVNYLSERLSIERIAETCDKFEEDLLKVPYPTVRGQRRVEVRFGEPILVPAERGPKNAVGDLTRQLEGRVQQLLDELNGKCCGG